MEFFVAIFGIIIGLLLVVLLSFWVYKDATKRKSDYAIIWSFAMLLFGFFLFPSYIILIPAYLVFRPDMPKERPAPTETYSVELCPNCGKYFRKPAKFCPNCGADVNNSLVKKER